MDNVTNLTTTGKRLLLFANQTLELLREEPKLIDWAESLFWIFTILGLTANITVASVIIKHRKVLLEIPSNLLVLNLAVADIICLVTVITLRIIAFSTQIDRGVASLASGLDGAVVLCQSLLSNWTVAVLAALQCAAVVWPLKFRVFITKKRTLKIIAVIWLVPVALSIPLLSVYRHGVAFESGKLYHEVYAAGTMEYVIMYINVFEGVSKLPPILTIFCLYPIIFQSLQKRITKNSKSNVARTKMRKSLAHITYVYITFLFYLSFNLVIYFLLFYVSFLRDADTPYNYGTLQLLRFVIVAIFPFQLFYTILNPVIHALVTENFKVYYIPWRWRKTFNVPSSLYTSEGKNLQPVASPKANNVTPSALPENEQILEQ